MSLEAALEANTAALKEFTEFMARLQGTLAAAPIAAPLTVPCCCAVMLVQPSIASAASVVKVHLILTIPASVTCLS